MTCGACGSPVPVGSRFCGHCGASVVHSCPQCNTTLGDGVRFCSSCGTPVASVESQAPTDRVIVATPTTERRVTTVLFGDLVGFTALSETRDSEDVRALLTTYFESARTVVNRYGGTIEKFIGDAVMAVWGVPVGHEDDAERGVRAGLELVDAVAAFGDSVGVPDLAMRVGVVTGEVAVTLGASGQGMVAGDAVNTAARVQSAATPGAVWVDRQTRDLARTSIVFRGVGTHELKGKGERLALYAATAVVAGVGGDRRREGVQAALIGRRRELASVRELFHAVGEDQQPRLLLAPGDPGVGKTRLAQELGNYLDGLTASVWWHWGRCLSYGDGVAFSALTAAVRGRIGAREDDDPETVRAHLAASLAEFVPDSAERSWLGPRLAALLGVESGSPTDHRRDDLFAAWLTWFERLSGPASDPVVWVIDDAHYADDGLLDFVEHLTTVARAPIFVIMLARPELMIRRPELATQRRGSVIRLERLSDPDVAALFDALVDGLPTQIRSELVRSAEGNPLFAIEIVRAMHDHELVGYAAEAGRLQLTQGVDVTMLRELGAPTSLYVLIASRLDLLAPVERSVLAAGSVLGQSFSTAGVSALTGIPEASLAPVVRELIRRDLLSRIEDRRSAERGQYSFVQAIVRTVAYQTQSRRDRLERHLAAAAVLGTLHESDGELAPVVAQHLRDARELAGPRDPRFETITSQLLDWAQRSGDRAMTVGAGRDAVRSYEQAIGLADGPAAAVRLHLLAGRAALQSALYDVALEHTRSIALQPDRAARTQVIEATAIAVRALRITSRLEESVELVRTHQRDWPWEDVEDEPAAELALMIGSLLEDLNRLDECSLWRDRAMRLAERSGRPQAIAETLVFFGQSAVLRGLRRVGMAAIQLATDYAREQHLVRELAICLQALAAFAIASDFATTLAAGDEGVALALSSGDRNRLIQIVPTHLIALRLAGQWDRIDALLEDAVTDDDPAATYDTMLSAQLALVREARTGTFDDIRWADDIDPADRSYDAVWNLLVPAFAARRAGQLAKAAVIAREASELAYEFGGLDDDYWHHFVLAVEWCLDADDPAGAREVLAPVDAAPGHKLTPLLAAELLRLRGTVAVRDRATAAPADSVELDLIAAGDALEALGAVPDAAKARASLGIWFVRQGREAEAAPHLTRARGTFGQLGAKAWLEALENELAGSRRGHVEARAGF